MMAPTKFGPLLGSSLLSWPAKLAAAREFFRRPAGPQPDRSVADFVRDHFGEEAVQYLAEPLLTGVFGGDVNKLSAKLVLARFFSLEEKYGSVIRGLITERTQSKGSLFKSLKGGMEQLTATLRARLDGVHFVSGTAESVQDGPRVRVSGEWIDAGAVIVAVRAWQAAPLVQTLQPELSQLLAGIEYSSAVTMGLTYKLDGFTHPLNGFGFLVPAIERRSITACTWVTRKFDHRTAPGHVVLRAFLGGDHWCGAADEDIYDAVRDDIRVLMNVDQMPQEFVIRRWPRSMPQYYVGHLSTVAAIQRHINPGTGVHHTGNYFDGVGIPDCIRRSKEVAERI
jgi:oxygen-dependent protoporphyrinogen oxidase